MTPRTIPPATGREETAVVGAILAAVLLAFLLRFAALAGTHGPDGAAPWEGTTDELGVTERSLARALLAGVVDVDAARRASGAWPEPAALRRDGVPPFDPTLMPPALRRYHWEAHGTATWVDYWGGAPAASGLRSLVLRVVDLHRLPHPHPHPGSDGDPDRPLAVQIWRGPSPGAPYPGERLPEAGWRWLRAPGDTVTAGTDGAAP